MQPLAGALVLELASHVAGPYCGRLLAELGARVVKIEEPTGGDPSRAHGPFPLTGPDPECSGLYLYCNAGKESVALDWRGAEGRETLRRLAARAGVLIDDLAPEEARRLGLDYASLSAGNPSLVQVSITPFGQTGPCAGWRAESLTIAHAGGEAYMLPPVIGHPPQVYARRPPMQAGGLIADYTAGLLAADAVLAALFVRDAHGAGQHIDLSRWEAEVYASRIAMDLWLNRGQLSGRYTVEVPNTTLFPCKDGWVFLTFHRQEQWERLAALMGRSEWVKEPRFVTAAQRRANLPAVHPEIIAWLSDKTGEEVFEMLESRGMLVAWFPTADKVLKAPQAKAIGLFGEVEAPGGRRVTLPRPLSFLPGASGLLPRAPRLGEHTEQVLDEFGLSSPKGEGPAEGQGPGPRLPPSRAGKAGESAQPVGVGSEPALSRAKRVLTLSLEGEGPILPKGPLLPLAGYRIVEFTWVAAGPIATHLLACLGADVIKIESRQRLDIARYLDFVVVSGSDPDASPDFHALNWNKRSVALDVKRPEALELVHDLVRISDAVVDNMRPRVMEDLGLGHGVLRQMNPSIVTVSASGFGPAGPQKDYPGVAAVFSGLSGLSAITGYPDGPPALLQLPLDMRAGATIALAVLAALLERARTGRGRHIDMASYGSIACLFGHTFAEVGLANRLPPRLGNGHPRMAPHGVFRCAGRPDVSGSDQWVSVAVATDEEWRALCLAMGREDLARDARFATAAGRRQRQSELEAVVAAWTGGQTPDEVTRLLQSAGVAAMPSMSNRRIAEDPHLKERGLFLTLDHAKLGRPVSMRPPWLMSRSPHVVQRGTPLLGEHTRDALERELGLPPRRVDELDALGVLQ